VRAWPAAAVLLGCVATVRAATRLTLTPALSLSAGYDDNLFLDPTLSGATSRPRADAVFDLRPSLDARLSASGHTLLFDADYGERITASNGDLRDLWLRLAWATPLWHRLRLTVGPHYEHYEAERYPDNRFDLAGAELALRLVLERAWIEAGYRLDGRFYGDSSRNHQVDQQHWALATAHLRLHRLVAVDAGYRFLQLASNAPTARLERHRADLLVEVRPTAWLTLAAGYGLWSQTLPAGAPPPNANTPGGARTDLAHAVTARVAARPLRWLELFLRYDLVVSTSDASNGRYQLNELLGGAVIGWTFAHVPALPPPPPPWSRPLVRGRVVTFRAQAAAGARVAVVGDWNGWQPAPLWPVGADRFAASYELPAGRHAFALSVDGVVRAPSDAAGYVEDGFGAKNGIVDVP
jgi:hypothetical protein